MAAATQVHLPKDCLTISKHQIELDPTNYPDLHDIDAVLITGSRHNSFDDSPWILKLVDFTKKALAQERVRIIGVCFGHQIVGRAMGAKLGRNPDGWEAAVYDMSLTAKGKEVFEKDMLVSCDERGTRDMVLTRSSRCNSCTATSCSSIPKAWNSLVRTLFAAVQGMYVRKMLITVQGHPEFNQEIMTEILEVRHKMGIFDDEAFAAAMTRVAKPHDGLVVSKAFLRFLLDD